LTSVFLSTRAVKKNIGFFEEDASGPINKRGQDLGGGSGAVVDWGTSGYSTGTEYASKKFCDKGGDSGFELVSRIRADDPFIHNSESPKRYNRI